MVGYVLVRGKKRWTRKTASMALTCNVDGCNATVHISLGDRNTLASKNGPKYECHDTAHQQADAIVTWRSPVDFVQALVDFPRLRPRAGGVTRRECDLVGRFAVDFVNLLNAVTCKWAARVGFRIVKPIIVTRRAGANRGKHC